MPNFNGLVDYDAFVEDTWFYEPAEHGGMPELGYTALALAEEAGEVAGKVKKAYRDFNGGAPPGPILMELGDVLFYATKLAHLIGVCLDDVAVANREKLEDRMRRGTMRGEGDDR